MSGAHVDATWEMELSNFPKLRRRHMQSKIRTTALLALLAFSSSIALAQSPVMSKETGPAASANFDNYWSDSISYGYESISISFWPGGTPKNRIMNLKYYTSWSICFVADSYCTQSSIPDVFIGQIPIASVTYSGQPEWNGSFQIALDVDTSLIDSSPTVFKVGNGGRIQFTCTQDPAHDVTSWSGEQTVKGLSGSTKQIGSTVIMQGNATSRIGLIPFDQFGPTELSSTCQMNWFKLTVLNK
jgi:hypothetical protein